jgi:hypothetical protein
VAGTESYSLEVLQDTFAIAHGMAVSYASSEQADSRTIDQLARLDRIAYSALRRLAQQPSSAVEGEAAVAALAAYSDYEEHLVVTVR